jgi:FAD/FMN-containing dehydrogenase
VTQLGEVLNVKAQEELTQKPLDFISQLKDILGAENVTTDLSQRVFFSTDIFIQGKTAEAVIAPACAEDLAQAVALATRLGRAVIPRGGGFSYTQGYNPVTEASIVVDLRRLNRILEINAEDRYVTVEAGVTWVQLYDALKARGLRTPYFGPLSGYRSTVGGAVSQGSFFLGSTQYGTTADTVLGLEVVLADGSIVQTGSGGSARAPSPFFRHYGPDLTGLFLHDTGAFGLKTKIALRLVKSPDFSRFATFAFLDQGAAIRALTEIGRTGIAAECYLWDPLFARAVLKNNSMSDNLRYVRGVLGAGRNPLANLMNALGMVVGGANAFDGKNHLLHMTLDDVSDAGADARLKILSRIGVRHGGKPVEPAAPRAMRARPFNDFGPVVAAAPEKRNLPIHGIFPSSRAEAARTAMNAYFEANAALMAEHGVSVGTIFFALGAGATCIEPLFYWTDPQLGLHDRMNDRTDVKALADFHEPHPATEVVARLRRELVDIFTAHGAVHCQIGKSYPYLETRRPEIAALLAGLKGLVDPDGLMNPGSLGLALQGDPS